MFIRPAVQANISHADRIVCLGRKAIRNEKRLANRRHRRYLAVVTRSFMLEPERFDEETFEAPFLTLWDLT